MSNLWRSIHPVLLHGKIISSHYYSTKHCRFSIKCTTTASLASRSAINSEISKPLFTYRCTSTCWIFQCLAPHKTRNCINLQIEIKGTTHHAVHSPLKVCARHILNSWYISLLLLQNAKPRPEGKHTANQYQRSTGKQRQTVTSLMSPEPGPEIGIWTQHKDCGQRQYGTYILRENI